MYLANGQYSLGCLFRMLCRMPSKTGRAAPPSDGALCGSRGEPRADTRELRQRSAAKLAGRPREPMKQFRHPEESFAAGRELNGTKNSSLSRKIQTNPVGDFSHLPQAR